MESGDIVVDQFSPTATLPDLPLARLRRVGSRGPLGHRVAELSAIPPTPTEGGDDLPGHGGGDDALMDAFVAAVADGTLGADHGASLESALDSHRMAFAAEDSRITGRTVAPSRAAV
jgi:predicted dehydrogenase